MKNIFKRNKPLLASEPHSFNQVILREYDMRGQYGKNLHDIDAHALGRAFAKLLRLKGRSGPVCVACDCRFSSDNLYNNLIHGLISSSVDVIKIGLVPTPMLYYATEKLGVAGGIMVTGSHNPSDYNGFKMIIGGWPVYGKEIQQLAKIAQAGDFLVGGGIVTNRNIFHYYIDMLLEKALIQSKIGNTNKRRLKIAWDCGNGAVGAVLPKLLDSMGHEHGHIVINQRPDGAFPNHHPDPTVPENMKQLIELVMAEQCDFGIAFDGDGDRIGVVDDKGRLVWGDKLLVLYSEETLSREPGSCIVADVKTSQMSFNEIERMGGRAVMSKTGHSLIKVLMKQENAILAGEMSGHMFFADNYGFDDAIFAALRLIYIMASKQKKLSDLVDAMPETYSTPEIRVECPEEEKFSIVEKVKVRLQKSATEFMDIDGVRVNKDDGWWLIRASNTQNCLVARVESLSKAGLKELVAEMFEVLEEAYPDFDRDVMKSIYYE